MEWSLSHGLDYVSFSGLVKRSQSGRQGFEFRPTMVRARFQKSAKLGFFGRFLKNFSHIHSFHSVNAENRKVINFENGETTC